MIRNRLYYLVKPWLPWRLRQALRRLSTRRIRAASRGAWPVCAEAGIPPQGWAGWPEGKKFAFLISHDVEGPDGLAKCRRLAELDASMGFRSSFNLIPEGSYAVPPELRQWLGERGFEVGVHDLNHDGRLYDSHRTFSRKAVRINGYLRDWGASGFRSAFMLRRLEWIHELDIAYDSSTFDTDPFEPQPNGAGTIFPYWIAANAGAPAETGYVEIPYTLPQDSTLFLLLRETTPDIWLKKLDWIALRGGMALVNVHPDYVRFPGEPEGPRTFPVAHYIALLKRVRDGHAGDYWNPLPATLALETARARPSHAIAPRKKVCLLTYSFYENDTRVIRYGQALAARGDEVEVLSLRSSPAQPEEEILDGCRVFRLQSRLVDETSPLQYLGRLLRFLARASRWISRSHARRPFDVLHVNNVPDFLVFAGWRPKLGGAKIILDIHDIVPELFASKFGGGPRSPVNRMLRLMERASAGFSTHVILANDLWRETYTRRSARPEKVSVLLNYVDSRIFAPRPRLRRDARKIVIFPGSLQAHQGLDVAIRAFAHVVKEVPAAELHIYGEGTAKPGLVALTAELGLGAHVAFFEPRSMAEIAGIMAEADLGVVPKRADSFGNEAFSTKIWEFMSLGIPVVASSTRIDRHYFDDSVVSFFESGNDRDLSRAIVSLLENPGAGSQMAARASAHAARNTWESRKGDYLGLVDRLCPAV